MLNASKKSDLDLVQDALERAYSKTPSLRHEKPGDTATKTQFEPPRATCPDHPTPVPMSSSAGDLYHVPDTTNSGELIRGSSIDDYFKGFPHAPWSAKLSRSERMSDLTDTRVPRGQAETEHGLRQSSVDATFERARSSDQPRDRNKETDSEPTTSPQELCDFRRLHDKSDVDDHALLSTILSIQYSSDSLTDQRHGSGNSHGSIPMDISPEEQLTLHTIENNLPSRDVCGARSAYLKKEMPSLLPPVCFRADNLYHFDDKRNSDQEQSEAKDYENASSSEENRTSPPQAEHRLSPDELGMSRPDRKSFTERVFQIYDENPEPPTPSSCKSEYSSNPLPKPPHMTSARHSPFELLDGHSPNDSTIHPSVERTTSQHPFIRESTPAYQDRSPSPSPTSQNEAATESLTLDTAMQDAPTINSTQRALREVSLPPESPHSGPMLPPPNPSRSLTSSPAVSPLREASPSTLRSPAIARVLYQSQSPHHDHQAQYPFVHRSLSPVGYPRHPSPLHHGHRRLSSHALERVVALLPPPPPPIPDDGPTIKPMKRGQRKKSGVGARIAKARSVTGAGTGIGTSNMRGGRMGVGDGKRQRAVTAALESDALRRDDCVDTIERVEDMNVDRSPALAVTRDNEVKGESETGTVRRSARLKAKM